MDPLHLAAAAVGITAAARTAIRYYTKAIGYSECQKSRPSEESCINPEERFYLVEESLEDAEFDIVIIPDVHNSRPSRRPEHAEKDQTVRWLRDNVPEAEKARILAYHYDTTLRTSEYLTRRTLLNEAIQLNRRLIHARADLSHGERRIIFVAHSLGGILLKNALIFSEMSVLQEERDILLSTAGCLFFNTPHNGSPNELCESIWTSVKPKLSAVQAQGSTWQQSEFFSWARGLASRTRWFDGITATMLIEPRYIRLEVANGKEINPWKSHVVVEKILMVLSHVRKAKCPLKVTLAVNLSELFESRTRGMIWQPFGNAIHSSEGISNLSTGPEPWLVRLKQLPPNFTLLGNSEQIRTIRGFDLVKICLQIRSTGPCLEKFELEVSLQEVIGNCHSGKRHLLLILHEAEEEGTIAKKLATQGMRCISDAEALSRPSGPVIVVVLSKFFRGVSLEIIVVDATGYDVKRLATKGGLRRNIESTRMDDKPFFLKSGRKRNSSSISPTSISLMQDLASNICHPTYEVKAGETTPNYHIAGRERLGIFSHIADTSNRTYSWDTESSGYVDALASGENSWSGSPYDAGDCLVAACLVDAEERNQATLDAISADDELGFTLRRSGADQGYKRWQ